MDFQGNNQESVLGMAQGSARSGAQVVTKAIAVCDTVFDDCDERPVDSDFVLPDYCPDIAAVLKCTLEPKQAAQRGPGERGRCGVPPRPLSGRGAQMRAQLRIQ